MEGSKYDVAFKREAIRMIKDEGQSVADISQKIGVHIKTLYRWLDENKKDGNDVIRNSFLRGISGINHSTFVAT